MAVSKVAPPEPATTKTEKTYQGLTNKQMVEFYRQYYTARNEQPQLLSLLAKAQKTETDVDRRVAMGIEMARAAEQRPQHADKAIEIWKGVLRVRPHLPEGVASLKRLYTATEKWNALLELLKDELEAVPAGDVEEKINRHLEIVGIYRDRLNLDVMVVTTYLNILALKPDPQPAADQDEVHPLFHGSRPQGPRRCDLRQ